VKPVRQRSLLKTSHLGYRLALGGGLGRPWLCTAARAVRWRRHAHTSFRQIKLGQATFRHAWAHDTCSAARLTIDFVALLCYRRVDWRQWVSEREEVQRRWGQGDGGGEMKISYRRPKIELAERCLAVRSRGRGGAGGRVVVSHPRSTDVLIEHSQIYL